MRFMLALLLSLALAVPAFAAFGPFRTQLPFQQHALAAAPAPIGGRRRIGRARTHPSPPEQQPLRGYIKNGA